MDQLSLQAGKKPALFIAVPNGKVKPQNSNEHSEETIQQIIYQLIKVDYVGFYDVKRSVCLTPRTVNATFVVTRIIT